MRNLFFVAVLSLAAVWSMAFVQDEKKEATSNSNPPVPPIAGKALFELKGCTDCHTLGSEAENERTPIQEKRGDAWFKEHAEQETPIVLREEKSKRRQRKVLEEEITALEAFLFDTKPEAREQIDAMSETVFRGAYLVYQQPCLNCHKIAGYGKEVAPELTQVGTEHDKSWFIANLKDPQQFNPESIMPKFDHLPEEDLESIAEYLLTLK